MFSSLFVGPVIEVLIPSDSEQNTFFTQKLRSIRIKRQSTSAPLPAIMRIDSLNFNWALLKKGLWHRCFPVNFVKFLRTPFLQNTTGGCFWIFWIFNPLSYIPGRREKNNLNFYFRTSLWCLKRFKLIYFK